MTLGGFEAGDEAELLLLEFEDSFLEDWDSDLRRLLKVIIFVLWEFIQAQMTRFKGVQKLRLVNASMCYPARCVPCWQDDRKALKSRKNGDKKFHFSKIRKIFFLFLLFWLHRNLLEFCNQSLLDMS